MNQAGQEKSIELVGIVAGCVIKNGDKYLLVQEKQPKAYGLWNIPAGQVNKGETIEDAARREAKEESGLVAEIIKKIGVFHNSAKETVKHAYACQVTGGELNPRPDEILDAKWLTYHEVEALHNNHKLRAPWVWEAITTVEKSDE